MATSRSWTEANSNPSIASAADSPARTSRKPENAPASRALAAAFGLNSPALLGFFDPDWYSLRTSQACLFLEQCPEWSESWPDSGMWDSGCVYELQSSGPAISESECSSSQPGWPTAVSTDWKQSTPRTAREGNAAIDNLSRATATWPTASASMIANDGETPESWKARQQRNIEKHYNGNGMGTPLTIAVSTWPTPTEDNANNAGGPSRQKNTYRDLTVDVANWATPQAHDSSAGNPERVGRFGTEHGGRNLADDVTLWQTPAADSFRSRGGELVNEMGLDQQARFFPTPASRDYRTPNKQSYQERSGTKKGEQLQNFVAHSLPAPAIHAGPTSCANGPTSRRRLNPRFVEWLMGFPVTWTEL